MTLEDELTGAVYLGDGVYCVEDSGWPAQIWLLTSNGLQITNRIALDSEVQMALGEVLGKRKGLK